MGKLFSEYTNICICNERCVSGIQVATWWLAQDESGCHFLEPGEWTSCLIFWNQVTSLVFLFLKRSARVKVHPLSLCSNWRAQMCDICKSMCLVLSMNEPAITKLSWDIQHIIGSSLGFVRRCRWSPARWHPWSLTSPNWSIYRPKKEGDEATSSCHCSLRLASAKRCGFRRWYEISGFKKLRKTLTSTFPLRLKVLKDTFGQLKSFIILYITDHIAFILIIAIISTDI